MDVATVNKSLVLTLLVVLVPASASASAPAKSPGPSVYDRCIESKAKELTEKADGMRIRMDHLGEIALLEDAYNMLPPSKRENLYKPLSQAYWEAYDKYKDERHLLRAKEMLSRHLETLTDGEGEARAKTEAELAKVDAEIQRLDDAHARVEAERAQEEHDRIAREATDKAVADEHARQRREELAKTERERRATLAEAERERERFVLYMSTAGTTAGIGVALLATMGVGLRQGELIDREGTRLADDPSTPPEELGPLVRRGTSFNQLAVSTGIIGGTLIVSATVIAAVAFGRKRAKGPKSRAGLAPRWQGLEVRF